MRTPWLALLLFILPVPAVAGPLTSADVATLREMSDRYVMAWMRNDREGVMSVLSDDAVFIPHDGVKPHIGYAAIDNFWFPGGKASGVVPAYTHKITDIRGSDNYATMYGRSDLVWQNATDRYHWVGNFLVVARKRNGRWLFTHMMSSDEQPKVEPLK